MLFSNNASLLKLKEFYIFRLNMYILNVFCIDSTFVDGGIFAKTPGFTKVNSLFMTIIHRKCNELQSFLFTVSSLPLAGY